MFPSAAEKCRIYIANVLGQSQLKRGKFATLAVVLKVLYGFDVMIMATLCGYPNVFELFGNLIFIYYYKILEIIR